jgi:hypothetical protein
MLTRRKDATLRFVVTALVALARRSSALGFSDDIEESVPQYSGSMDRPRMFCKVSSLLSLQGFSSTRHHSFLFLLLNKPILISIR